MTEMDPLVHTRGHNGYWWVFDPNSNKWNDTGRKYNHYYDVKTQGIKPEYERYIPDYGTYPKNKIYRGSYYKSRRNSHKRIRRNSRKQKRVHHTRRKQTHRRRHTRHHR